MLCHFHGLYSHHRTISLDQSACEDLWSYCKKSIGTCKENMGFGEMRGGMNMCRTVYLKMRITRCCGILVYEQTMKLRLGGWIYWSLTKKRNCNFTDVAIMDYGRWKGASKRGWVEKYQNLTRESQKMWGVRTMMMPIVVGALGTILLRLKENQRTIGVDASIQLISKYAL